VGWGRNSRVSRAGAGPRRCTLRRCTAIWAPELLLRSGSLYFAPDNHRLFAGIVAIAVAWRCRRTFVTIAAGLAALHFFDRLV